MGNYICVFILIIFLNVISAKVPAGFWGGFQSDIIGTEIVLISVDRRNKTFEQYISCRLVNKGVYYQRGEEIYHFDGDLEDFDIALNKKEWSFEINIPKLNEGKAIVLRKVGDIPVSFAEYGDEEEYKKYFYSD